MKDSIDLFAALVNATFFEKSLMILFLNKTDLLEQKLLVKNYADYDASYTGPNTSEEVAKHIGQRFLKKNKVPNRECAIYHTCTVNSC